MTDALVFLVLGGMVLLGVWFVVTEGIKYIRSKPVDLSSRGEESGVPEDPYTTQDDDELMAIAEAVADNKDNQHWEMWEQEMSGGVPE